MDSLQRISYAEAAARDSRTASAIFVRLSLVRGVIGKSLTTAGRFCTH